LTFGTGETGCWPNAREVWVGTGAREEEKDGVWAAFWFHLTLDRRAFAWGLGAAPCKSERSCACRSIVLEVQGRGLRFWACLLVDLIKERETKDEKCFDHDLR